MVVPSGRDSVMATAFGLLIPDTLMPMRRPATPLVDLYALTNPQHTPWLSPSLVLYHDVACRNCYKSVCPQGHHDCLTKVEPARVVGAVHSLLG